MLRVGANGLETFKTSVTPQLRADLIRRLAVSQNDISRIRSELDSLKGKHSARWKGYNDTLSGIYKQHFEPHAAMLKPFYDKILEGFPPWFRNRPEARLLASSLASNQFIEKKYASQLAAAGNTQRQAAAKQSAGPTQDELQQGATGTAKPAKSYSDEEYARVKALL